MLIFSLKLTIVILCILALFKVLAYYSKDDDNTGNNG